MRKTILSKCSWRYLNCPYPSIRRAERDAEAVSGNVYVLSQKDLGRIGDDFVTEFNVYDYS